eukprot:m.88875 g.88875  ORF g.88875 m.88875 type:complete len:320 (+) comp8386_c0_seq2:511-1470(+)
MTTSHCQSQAPTTQNQPLRRSAAGGRGGRACGRACPAQRSSGTATRRRGPGPCTGTQARRPRAGRTTWGSGETTAASAGSRGGGATQCRAPHRAPACRTARARASCAPCCRTGRCTSPLLAGQHPCAASADPTRRGRRGSRGRRSTSHDPHGRRLQSTAAGHRGLLLLQRQRQPKPSAVMQSSNACRYISGRAVYLRNSSISRIRSDISQPATASNSSSSGLRRMEGRDGAGSASAASAASTPSSRAVLASVVVLRSVVLSLSGYSARLHALVSISSEVTMRRSSALMACSRTVRGGRRWRIGMRAVTGRAGAFCALCG